MAERALVNSDIAAAERLVSFLDANGFPVKAALWLYESEAERWRFVISFQEKRQNIGKFYPDIAKLFNARGLDRGLLELDRVRIVDAERSIVEPLSKGMQGVNSAGRRLVNEQVNGVFFEDALILRLPA